jgi:hypothetical protein
MGELDPSGLWITNHDGSDTRLVGQPKFAGGEAYLDSGRFATGLGALASYVRGLSK